MGAQILLSSIDVEDVLAQLSLDEKVALTRGEQRFLFWSAIILI